MFLGEGMGRVLSLDGEDEGLSFLGDKGVWFTNWCEGEMVFSSGIFFNINFLWRGELSSMAFSLATSTLNFLAGGV